MFKHRILLTLTLMIGCFFPVGARCETVDEAIARMGGYQTEPAWSPTGTHIAYVAKLSVSSQITGLWLWDLKNNNREKLTATAEQGVSDSSPTWSPDGQKVAYIRKTKISPAQIRTIDMVTRQDDFLHNIIGLEREPVYSPDGKTMLFVWQRAGRLNYKKYSLLLSFPILDGPDSNVSLFVDAENRAQYLNQIDGYHEDVLWRFMEHSPTWAPDGSKIAFSRSNMKENRYREAYQIYIAREDGSGMVRLTATQEDNTSPAWSPNGQYIAFRRNTYPSVIGSGNVMLLRWSDKRVIPLTKDGGYGRPSWSPNGSKLVVPKNGKLQIINLQGKKVEAQP